jgi:hypothetical protein
MCPLKHCPTKRGKAIDLKKLIKPVVLLAITMFCLIEFALYCQSDVIKMVEDVLLQTRWMLLACLAVWCGTFLVLTFSLKDLLLIGLLFIAIMYFIHLSVIDAIMLFSGATLGKGARVLLRLKAKGEMLKDGGEMHECMPEFSIQHSAYSIFLIGLVMLLAFSSWWQLKPAIAYHGPRWTGLWDSPNIYGILMGTGVVLTAGLLLAARSWELEDRIEKQKSEIGKQKHFYDFRKESRKQNNLRSLRSFVAIKSAICNPQSAILFIAALMMGTGLLFSYSRGAWLGTAVGLLYLAKAYRKFKWRSPKVFLLSAFCFLVLIFGVCFFWNNTSDTAPWYLKRLDLSRGSVQHRVAAWKAGFEMMRDHPFGVGWNKAVAVYEKNYSPPENGAAAITTNDYLMLGTQLGFPGLICFIAYVALCFRKCGALSAECGIKELRTPNSEFRIKTACRAGALAMLVAFWFDGGLFKLATASVFWILLELSQIRSAECGVRSEVPQSEIRNQKSAIGESLVTPAATK